MDRWAPFIDYFSKQLGTKVTLRVANDYAAVIEGQRAGNIHIAYYGPASFARALIVGVKTEAFAIDVNSDGSKGYYSVFYVLAKAPYQKIEDLKGKPMAFVDPNSTSVNNMPRFVLDGMGIDPETFSTADTDKDGALDTEELRRFLARVEPEIELQVRLPDGSPGAGAATIEAAGPGGKPLPAKVKVERLSAKDIEIALDEIHLEFHVEDGDRSASEAKQFLGGCIGGGTTTPPNVSMPV